MQEFRLPNIAKALVKQAEKGIKVRIILENTYNRHLANFSPAIVRQMESREKQRYEQYINFIDVNDDQILSNKELEERDIFTILNQDNISIIYDTEDGSKGTGLMHHKLIIIDDKVMIISSANLTLSGIHGDFNNEQTRGNANNLFNIKSSELAQLFTEEFNLMWGDGKGGKKDSQFGINKLKRWTKTIKIGESEVTVKFSPDSSKKDWPLTTNRFISSVLNNAKSSIKLALFFLVNKK